MYVVNLKCRCINWDISNSSSTFLSTFTLWLIPFPSFTLSILRIFSKHVISFNLTKNGHRSSDGIVHTVSPEDYFENNTIQIQNTNLYPSCRRSSISAAWQRSVRRRAELVWAVSVSGSQFGIFSWSHSSIQSANALKNCGFWSSFTAAFPNRLFAFSRVFELEMVHNVDEIEKFSCIIPFRKIVLDGCWCQTIKPVRQEHFACSYPDVETTWQTCNREIRISRFISKKRVSENFEKSWNRKQKVSRSRVTHAFLISIFACPLPPPKKTH